MDSSYPHPQVMGQSPFFYYNPDPKPDNRQHGHFSQHPSNIQVPMYHPHVQPMPSTPIYSRPNSSCSQPPMHPHIYNAGYQTNMTPMASPRPMYQKPTILIQDHSPRLMIDVDCHEGDMYYYPSTPPLSASGSVMSSPSSCDVLQTPMNTMFMGLEGFEGVKEGCQGEVQSENLAGGDWQRCGSRPMTPVYIQLNSLMSNGNASELLSATSCPSLSPSPSPYPRSVISEQDFDFCDPRNLTIGSGAPSNPLLIKTTAAEFPPLPTLYAGDDEEHQFMLGGESFNKAAETHAKTFNFSVPTHHHGLPTFDQFSDLDSEEDFVNGLVNFPATDNVQFFDSKRQRTNSRSDLVSLDHEPFIDEDDFEDFEDFEDSEQFAVACLPSPPASGSPALLPRISPSIKPLLPGGKGAEDTASLLLASKSNYQNILEGTHLPGVSYPTELSTNLTSKRTSHKIAEQGRRNRINSALQEIAKDRHSRSSTWDWKSIIPLRENKRKILRILLKSKEQIACPDSGSMQNIMSEAFAIENNLEISRKRLDLKPFELGSGTRVWSIGRVRTTVELLGKRLRRKLRTFYVFATCPVPLILGMPFLQEAEILTKNRHMLETCPLEISSIPSLLWIGSPQRKRRSTCNRMKCTLDGRKLVAIADTGADLNFMCPECAEREGFNVDTREEARRIIQFGDGTEAETVGEVYIHNLSLNWREPIREAPEPASAFAEPSLPQTTEESVSFGTVFHVLPGLPCDVILGRDVLDETDAFNRCSELSCTQSSRNKNPFELNIMIFKPKRKIPDTLLEPTKDAHDNERHAEMFRRSKREAEISLLPEDQRKRAKARERIKSREWDVAHANCTYCSMV